MLIILDTLSPVFAIVFTGYLIGRRKILDSQSGKVLNEFVLYIALPALLFISVASAPVEQLFDSQFLGANLLGILASFLVAVILEKFFFKSQWPTLALQGMAASYGTTGYMGIPLLIAAFGEKAALPASLATLIHNIPVITIVVLSFETYKSKEKKFLNLVSNISRVVITNPLMLAVFGGLIFAVIGINLPKSIREFCQLLADASGPCALFALGLGLVRQSTMAKNQVIDNQQVMLLVILKLVLQPLVTLVLVTYVFKMEPLWSTVSVLMSALPVGAGVYVFAQKYNTHSANISKSIFISMIISLGSLALWLSAISLLSL